MRKRLSTSASAMTSRTTGTDRWHPVAGEWLAVTDPKGENVALSRPHPRTRPLPIAGKATWTDYLIEVDTRPSKGPAGVCFLFTSPTDYWLWRFLPGASRQELVRVTEAGETIHRRGASWRCPDKGFTGVAIRVGSDFIRVTIPGADDLDALLPWRRRGQDRLLGRAREQSRV